MRTLVVITTTCFPDPKVRAIRWTQLARELPEHGWRVVFLSRYYGHAASDQEIAQAIHPAAVVEYIDHPLDAQPTAGSPQGQASGATGRKSRLRTALAPLVTVGFPPDPSQLFWTRARPRLAEALSRHRPDAVVVGFPPGGNVCLTSWLAKHFDGPVVADFEDPFTFDSRFRPRGLGWLVWPKTLSMERAVYRDASLILHAIPLHARWARLRFGEARRKIRLLMMGFSPTMLDGGVEPILDSHGRRSIRVVGAMGDAEMLQLARAVKILVDRGENLSLMLVGKPPETSDEIRGVLGDRVEITGRVEHRRAMGAILGADVLVNYVSAMRRRSFLLSSKLFEYVAAGKPVVEVNPSRSDRFFVRQLPGVMVLSDPDDAELSAVLLRAVNGEGVPDEAARQALVAEHAWPAKAARVARWLDDLVDGRPLSE